MKLKASVMAPDIMDARLLAMDACVVLERRAERFCVT